MLSLRLARQFSHHEKFKRRKKLTTCCTIRQQIPVNSENVVQYMIATHFRCRFFLHKTVRLTSRIRCNGIWRSFRRGNWNSENNDSDDLKTASDVLETEDLMILVLPEELSSIATTGPKWTFILSFFTIFFYFRSSSILGFLSFWSFCLRRESR